MGERYAGRALSQPEIEVIRVFTGDCPNLIFGTPEYPIPPVACGRRCDVFAGECKLRAPQKVRVTEEVKAIQNRILTTTTPRLR